MPRPHAAAPLPLPPSSGRRWPQLLLVAAAVAGTVLLLEVACRLLGVDFEFKARAFERVPIFYRQPVVPVGDGFFRRPGPATWTGRVLDAGMRAVQRHEGIYAADPVVTIAYDRDGFRNPEDLADWGVAVAGDSFTELGHLPYEELFTTGLARRLGTGVRNLGVSYTGPFTQTFYLRAYGRAPSTSDAVLVFFEGNDFGDVVKERRRMDEASRAAPRPPARSLVDELEPQSSLLLALSRLIARLGAEPAAPPGSVVNAYFVHGGSRSPVTLVYRPGPARELPERTRSLMTEALAAWGTTARELGLRPWLAFMPCKRRVLDGHLVEPTGEPLPPLDSDLPVFIEEAAARGGVRFVNLVPALRAHTEEGRLTYNGVWDTHLNVAGSRAVAETLAGALSAVRGR
jgi:hypothetical protein